MARIEFVGNAIFIPFFLISVGMLVDLRVLGRGPQAAIVAASLTLGALLGKWLAALSTQKIFKYQTKDSIRLWRGTGLSAFGWNCVFSEYYQIK